MNYLIDASALHRLDQPEVAAAPGPLIESGRVNVCAVTELEVLFSARGLADYGQALERFRTGFAWVPVPEQGWERAAEIQHELARRGKHRAASIPDLLLSVTAESHGLTLLHYDRDFEPIAEITGQPTRWVVPPGTVD